MNSLLLRTLAVGKSPSLQAFNEYREAEASNFLKHSSVSTDGVLLEYETLELRVHPPNVEIDNETFDDRTLITVDSANRPGTLVEVVQCLTELGLNVRKARISSDGGWFVDEFHVSDSNMKVLNERKLRVIRKVLSVDIESDQDQELPDQNDESKQLSTIFELSGTDRVGLLADVVKLLTDNGCTVRSAAVWTFNEGVAFVVSVLEKGQPIKDSLKLQRLKQMLFRMMGGGKNSIVNIQTVKGVIHYDRRLHLLLLKAEEKNWHAIQGQKLDGTQSPLFVKHADSSAEMQNFISPKSSKPEITIQHYKHHNYWLVTIKCKDRTKLLFDTVCTLADLNYDVYHAAVDCEGDQAVQMYYVRPRYGDFYWDAKKAEQLKYGLESAIQRRFPKGLKVHIMTQQDQDLSCLTEAWKEAGLCITRATVRAYSSNTGHTFYLMDQSGMPPDLKKVQGACQAAGGKLLNGYDLPSVQSKPGSNVLKFGFAFQQRVFGSPDSTIAGSL